MKYYCLSCNKATEWNGNKPNFCSHCGKSYIDTFNAPQNAAQTPNPVKTTQTPSFSLSPRISQSQAIPRPNQPIRVSDDDPENDAQYVPKVDRIDFGLTVDNLRPNRETAAEVFNQGMRGEQVLKKGKSVNNDFTPRQKKKISKKEEARIKENFKNEFKNTLSKKTRGHQIESQEIE